MSDRTHDSIRASVDDVQFTLDPHHRARRDGDLRLPAESFWATVIPSITVPLALLGAFALMWVAGYSLDNLSR